MNPPSKAIKKSGHGNANWGSFDDEIIEGISIVAAGGKAKGGATAQELGMAKLSTSPSSPSMMSSSLGSNHSFSSASSESDA
ncbi:hypothetical protein MNV49_004156 [Pseudohyphozyma bogoriensis]|nr:hypothetical protein MNV49_004156 [Pseudohyphozyma bogoriensis]